MNDVDIGLHHFTTEMTTQSLMTYPVKMNNIKLNTDSGLASADLWVEHTDVSSFTFRVLHQEGASFTAAALSNWTITSSLVGTETVITGMYTGGLGTQTADRIKIGSYRFQTPELDSATPEMRVLSASASNDLGSTVSVTAPVGVKVSFDQTTQVAAPVGPEDGSYNIQGLADGIYLAYADRDFTAYTTYPDGSVQRSSELAAITAADARAALLISLGRGSGDARAIIAADLDGNGMVTAADARNILLMSLGRPAQLEKMDWRFIDEAADLSQVSRFNVREGVNWQQGAAMLLEDDTTRNLVGILLGDVNGSWRPGSLEEQLIKAQG
jgi:hypothetical protein